MWMFSMNSSLFTHKVRNLIIILNAVATCPAGGKYFTGRDPLNQNSDREKWSISKGGPIFSKLFRLDRTDPLSFGLKFPVILVEWIALTVKPGKPWTPEIFLECYCVARKKPIRREKAKPQARAVCGFVASSRVLIFAVIGRNTINIPETF